MELQSRVAELQREGLGLVAISYDSPAVLKTFADAKGITFPLVSDDGSAIIRRYGLLNTTVEPGTRTYGIPFPGTFIVDRKGVVRSRHFEEAYQERSTAASILARAGGVGQGPMVTIDTAHLSATATLSDGTVAPGERLTMVLEARPHRGMHVYAPGKHDYQVVRVTVQPREWLKAFPATYPSSEIYEFKPLNERVEVYQKPFRLVQDLTILATPAVQKLLAGQSSLSISARLEYQACDDKVCYSPQSVPLDFTLGVKALERK